MQIARLLRSGALVLVAGVTAFAADEAPIDPAAELFRRAEIEESALGNLDRAAELFKEAGARAADPAVKASAALRRASCLRRTGRPEAMSEARASLEQLAAGEGGAGPDVRRAATEELAALGAAPATRTETPDAAAPRVPAEDLAKKEQELAESRDAIELLLSRETESATRYQRLVDQYRKLEAEVSKLRADAAIPDPATAEEALDRARKRRAREREESQRNARMHLAVARLFYRSGSFVEARRSLYEAEACDPENAEVRALLSALSAPLGEREALFEKVLEVAALAREVRVSHLAAEVGRLADDARARQGRGDFAGSVAPLEQALARIEAAAGLLNDGGAARAQVMALLQAATAKGAQRAPVALDPLADDDEKRWAAALRGLLEEGGASITPGLILRFHDAAPVLAARALPPVPVAGTPQSGWELREADTGAARLLAAFVRGEESRSFAQAAAAIRVVGSSLVALTDMDTQRRIADRFSSLRIASPTAGEIRVVAFRADHAAVEAVLARRAVAVADDAGVRSAVLSPADADAVLGELAAARDAAVADATLRATPLRAFRVVAGQAAASLAVDVLPVGGLRAGVGVRATTSVVPRDRPAAPPLASSSIAGAPLAAGGALLLFGLPDPERPSAGIAVLVRSGVASPATGGAALPLPKSADPVPVPSGAAEIELPTATWGDDPPLPASLVPERPVATRRDAILRRLADVTRGANLVDVRRDRIVVVGPASAQQGARAFAERLGGSPAQSAFEVRLFQVGQDVEREIISQRPRLSAAEGSAFSFDVVRTEAERRAIEARLRLGRGEIVLLDPIARAAPTIRGDVARIVESSVAGADGLPVVVQEGLVLSVRPLDRGADGRLAVDVSLRARRMSPGKVVTPEPWWGDLRGSLGRGESLVLVGARSPFAASPDVDRLIVLIRPIE